MLNQYLQQLGFSDKEIAVYLCILENGKLSAAAVSRITKINRTTVYSVSKELIKKAVIHEDLGGTNRYYTALPPEELKNLYKAEEEKLNQKKMIIDDTIRELSALPKSKQYSVPKIRFIDELHMNDFLFKQLPVWIESAKKQDDHNWWGFQDATLLEEYKDWIEYHWKIFPEDFGTRLITNDRQAEKELAKKISNEKRQVKYWDKTVNFTATHAVLGDYVLFIVTNQHPYYLVETHDAVMAQNLREMFKGFWEKI
jgi:sugar-specific transcriptional regulator TrmB